MIDIAYRYSRLSAVVLLAFAACLAVSAASAQSSGERTYRLAQLAVSQVSLSASLDWTLPALAQKGFAAGRNLIFDARVGSPDQLPELMQELLARKPDAILVIGHDALRAAAAATNSVPIVMFGPNPVQMGLAQTLARPGSNVTGVVILASELDAKRLDLLYEALPRVKRVAALLNPASPARASSESEMRGVAAKAGFELVAAYAREREDYQPAFAAMRVAGVEAVAITADPEFYRDTETLVALARDAQLPAICQWHEMTKAGCVLSYGPNLALLRRKLADHLVRIFRGTSAGEVPIEQPTDFELSINLKVARALGIVIPPSLLARADEVIE